MDGRVVSRLGARLAIAAVLFGVGAAGAAVADVRPLPPRAPVPGDGWLGTVNHYRTQSGVDPVTSDDSRSRGIALHLEYLTNTPASLRTGEYANAHTENPASPWYTPEGDAAGRSSNLGGGSTDRLAVETWMAAPFHAIGILRPNLRTAAFARSSMGSAGLDVIRGLGSPSDERQVVLFPGPGSVNHLSEFRGESPDPTEPCGTGFTGLPLIALLAEPPPADTSASLGTPDGSTVTEGDDLCVVTAATFATSDSMYGATGVSVLDGDNAVLVIPRHPLTPGRHDVSILGSGRTLEAWSFTQAPSFLDVHGHEYFATPVRWLAANNITSGIGDQQYGPAIDVNRGQMAMFLHRFAGSPSPTVQLRYDDVRPEAPYATAVRWLDEEGITSGSSATSFQPLVTVTRGQMAAFLHRLAGQPAPTSPSRFSDVPADAYYSAAVRWLDEQGIADGIGASTFGPRANVTRGQMAAFLQRLDVVLNNFWT